MSRYAAKAWCLAGVLGLMVLLGCTALPSGAGRGDGDGGGAGPPSAAVPAKSLSYDLIAIHDRGAADYNGDCISCHGDRTDEVARDGTTPAAHSTMLAAFSQQRNARCIACHQDGPDFLTFSRGGLREQVDMGDLGCVTCHGAQATLARAFYAR